MKELSIEIITPAKAAYSGMAKSITIPGSLGGFQVLYNHAPLMSSFEIGYIKIKEQNGEVLQFSTGGGTVEVLDNKVLILAESFESKDEIDVDRAKRAMERAQKRLSRESGEEKIDLARADAALKRAINRLKLSGNY